MKLKPEPLAINKTNWIKPVISLTVLVVLMVIAYIGLDYTGKSSFCVGCHEMKSYAKSRVKTKHKDTACIDCHQEPGIAGALSQRADILSHYGLINLYFQRQRPTLATTVSAAGCLKCHQAIMTSTVLTAQGVRVNHKSIVAAGLNCGRCHADTGHKSKAAASSRPVHDYCFACHKTPKTGSKCDFCHTKDVGDKGPKQLDFYKKAELNLKDCDACHSTASCTACHAETPQLEGY